MTDPNRLPLRVLVKGPSTPVYTSWMSGPRSDFTWPRALEAELHAAGYPAEVRNLAMPAEPTRLALRSWQEEVLAWSPDVVVLGYGEFECVHLFLPRFLERHAHAIWGRPFPVRTFYRKRVLRPLWMTLARLQAMIDARLPPTLLSFRRRRVAADLERLIGLIRTVASPLVLIPDIAPPGAVYRRWFPGMAARNAAMNDTLADLVARLDHPDIRFIAMNDRVAAITPEGEDMRPDGGHYTPEGHRLLGEIMGDVILGWAAEQTHLDLDDIRARRAQPARPRLAAGDG